MSLSCRGGRASTQKKILPVSLRALFLGLKFTAMTHLVMRSIYDQYTGAGTA